MEKGEIARNEQFLLFPHCFYPFGELSAIFIKIQNCRLQTILVGKSLKFVVWGRVKKKKKHDRNIYALNFAFCLFTILI